MFINSIDRLQLPVKKFSAVIRVHMKSSLFINFFLAFYSSTSSEILSEGVTLSMIPQIFIWFCSQSFDAWTTLNNNTKNWSVRSGDQNHSIFSFFLIFIWGNTQIRNLQIDKTKWANASSWNQIVWKFWLVIFGNAERISF